MTLPDDFKVTPIMAGNNSANPLDGFNMFQMELMNPNPTARQTKDGPIYRVSFEMHRADWQQFMDANTKGMILEMQGRVVESNVKDNTSDAVPKLKGGPLSIEAAQYCSQTLPNEYALDVPGPNNSSNHYGSFQTMIYCVCGVESRAELDHSDDAAYKWNKLKNDFITWSENREPQEDSPF